ncbi:F-box/kelch-repeat protein At3g06240-like [Chenopodium quinoa]|uniref:F-box/kelch-repeat protein At3g06240-like n=1 Tax=Chenopodium quinoa TaxID=63459 RepID=UPI000B7885B7|nr:F-box/kelch-repeat protein At3g06240-like [Chenopodium quinoa]
MANIPIDILESEILIRLPIESLCRFKSPRALDLASSDSSTVKLPCYVEISNGIIVGDNYTWIGCCNGLHCVAKSETASYVVFNPITGSYNEISLPKIIGRGWQTTIISGFGYDDVNDDYKLVMFKPVYDTDSYYWQIYVYSLNANSWRYTGVKPAVVIDNHLLHLTFSYENMTGIGCFDIRTEQWSVLKVPDSIKPDVYRYIPKFGIFDGCLYLLTTLDIRVNYGS